MVSVKSLVAFYSSFSAPAVGLAPRHGSHRPKPTIRLFAQTQAQAPEPVVRDAPKHTIGDAKRAVNKVDEVVRPADAEAKVVVSAGADLVLAPATTKAVSKGALTKQAHLDDAELTLLHAMVSLRARVGIRRRSLLRRHC